MLLGLELDSPAIKVVRHLMHSLALRSLVHCASPYITCEVPCESVDGVLPFANRSSDSETAASPASLDKGLHRVAFIVAMSVTKLLSQV